MMRQRIARKSPQSAKECTQRTFTLRQNDAEKHPLRTFRMYAASRARAYARTRARFHPLTGVLGAVAPRHGWRRHGQSPRRQPCLRESEFVRSGLVSTFYEIDGERYPRVTSVCAVMANAGLAYWRGRVGNDEADRVSREATQLGTRAHKAIERYVKRLTCTCSPHCSDNPCSGFLGALHDNVAPIVEAYIRWHEEHVRAIVASEKLSVSRLHKFAGTVDLIAVLDDDRQPSVLDIKTSNYVSETWGLQTAAYQLSLDEEGIECGRRVIVQLPSKEPGVCHIHDLNDHDRDQRAFINALKLYRWKESQKPPESKGPRIRFGGRRP